MSPQITVLTLTDYYWPGCKAGGCLRTVKHMVDLLSPFLKFKLVTRDRDLGDVQPYRTIPIGRWCHVAGAEVFYIPQKRLSVGRLRVLFKETSYDLLYLNGIFSPHFTLAPLLLRKLALVERRPVLIAVRGECAPSALAQKRWRKWIFLKMESIVGLYEGVTLAASNEMESAQIRRVFPQASVVLLPDIAASPRSEDPPQRSPKYSGTLKILFLARIAPVKNLKMALEIVRHLKGQVTLDIFGPIEDEKYWRECSRKIDSMPENVTVTYNGVARPDSLSEVMGRSDVLLLPTLGENFGHVIVEALGNGLPSIISDRTPWRDLGAAGADVSLGDFNGFVRTLQTYVDMGSDEYSTHRGAALELARRVALDESALKQQAAQLQSLVQQHHNTRSAEAIPGSVGRHV